MQAESTSGDFPRHYTADLDRVTGAVQCSADRWAGWNGQPDHATHRAQRGEDRH
ncbi:MAG: hypothetical protein QOJ61_3403, partial [Mycobacterium sp.]|nr:hypothetical protein [Mycobacterium sp.]